MQRLPTRRVGAVGQGAGQLSGRRLGWRSSAQNKHVNMVCCGFTQVGARFWTNVRASPCVKAIGSSGRLSL
jgi:hypothetical protein